MRSPERVVTSPIAVKISTAAMMAEVSSWTIYGWIKKGLLKPIGVGQNMRIIVKDLEKLLVENQANERTDIPARGGKREGAGRKKMKQRPKL